MPELTGQSSGPPTFFSTHYYTNVILIKAYISGSFVNKDESEARKGVTVERVETGATSGGLDPS